MCGIFGIVTTKPRTELIEPINRAASALKHRGPDDQGLEFVSSRQDGLTVAFAHQRLSILDLSPAGHQPMRDEATGNWITYNGEVFNFRDVRRKLESRGLSFRSQSDTEVILKGYGLLGREAIADWRGMFAFGLWESKQRRLTLVRDRLGIKPLYYYSDGESFIFASELRALLATGLVPRRLSGAALDSYLAFGSVQQPLTIIENVYAVLPGHTLTVENGRVVTEPYWELQAGPADEFVRDDGALVAEIRELLIESVKLRMVSDVPVGVFLSGGIDSGAVVAFIRQATAAEVRTFSICFEEQEFNEQAYAEQVARQFGTAHQSVVVSEREALARLPLALRAMDQPSVDGLNTYLISEAVARSGLKVAISGLGGDEVFAGYKLFRTVARDEQIREQVKNLPQGLRVAAASAIDSVARSQRAAKVSALLRGDHLQEHSVQLHRQLFTGRQRDLLLGKSDLRSNDAAMLDEWTRRRLTNCARADHINQASALELGGYLGNTLLRDTDAMSMAHSLEVRVPLIDHHLVTRMMHVPGAAKLENGRPKWILTAAAADLPGEAVHRPKRGFELPFKLWLQGALRPQIEEAFRKNQILDPDSVQSVWQSFLNGRSTWSRAWGLYAISEWASLNL